MTITAIAMLIMVPAGLVATVVGGVASLDIVLWIGVALFGIGGKSTA